MNVSNFIKIALIGAVSVLATACSQDKMKAAKNGVTEFIEEKVSACPTDIEGFWGVIDEDGKKVPTIVIDKDEEGNLRFTDLVNFKESLVIDQEPKTLSFRNGVENDNKINKGSVTCEDGNIIATWTKRDPFSDRLLDTTTTVWSLDSHSRTGNIETESSNGKTASDVVVNIIIEDQEKN